VSKLSPDNVKNAGAFAPVRATPPKDN